jgi:hypothetical protein
MCPTPDSAVYDHLLKLKASLGPKYDRRDRAILLIIACIEKGFDTRHKILEGTRVAGLSRDNVEARLAENTGEIAGMHLWRLDADGRYFLARHLLT